MRIGFVRESYYPNWLSNPVLIPKSNKKWRTFIDFTNLNKACSFLLPQINQLVDVMAGHKLLIFMDVYSGYNQIPMYELDEEHTSFITDCGLYYYKAMPFGLKNAETTYQRLVNAIFKDLIGKTMEVYVDDMLVRSKATTNHMDHLGQMFSILRKYQMKFKPLKCAFGVGLGKFLGFMVNQQGIDANLEKIKELLDISSPRKPKEVMSLAGKVATLSRFVSRATYHCVSFFDVLKGSKKFEWTDKCEQAFQALKQHLGQPSLLSKPIEGDKLYMYLIVSKEAVSAALIREEEKVQ